MDQSVKEIIEYCEKMKAKEKRIAFIVENVFRDKFGWTFNYPYIAIDMPLENLMNNILYYDSTVKKLYVYRDGELRDIDSMINDFF
jgi:hypothetical protein